MGAGAKDVHYRYINNAHIRNAAAAAGRNATKTISSFDRPINNLHSEFVKGKSEYLRCYRYTFFLFYIVLRAILGTSVL